MHYARVWGRRALGGRGRLAPLFLAFCAMESSTTALASPPISTVTVRAGSCVEFARNVETICSDGAAPWSQCAKLRMNGQAGCRFTCPHNFTSRNNNAYCSHQASSTNITGWLVLDWTGDSDPEQRFVVSLFDNEADCRGSYFPNGDCRIAAVHVYGSNAPTYDSSMAWTHLSTVHLWHDGTDPTPNKKFASIWPNYRWVLIARYAGDSSRSNPWMCFSSKLYRK